MTDPLDPDFVTEPPVETQELRVELARFLDTPFDAPDGARRPLGSVRWGVYAFYDYDGEPIYVGQTNEMLRTRIRRHLTNQRTDAVAMSVLDPFEVFEIEVWPLSALQERRSADPEARAMLDALERQVIREAVAASATGAILNEKDPPQGALTIEPPPSIRGRVVSERVRRLRGHPDTRIARRALVLSRLAQAVAERKAPEGLRRALLIQTRRLERLASRRYAAMGGAQLPPSDATD